MRLAYLFLGLFILMSSPTFAQKKQVIVVIDPGHGGRDTGAKVGKVYEKTLNLDLSYRVSGHLQRKGYAYLKVE